MKTAKMLATALALILVLTIPALTLAENTAAAGKTYTIEEMLTLALQNEYAAQAQYTAAADALRAGTRMNGPFRAGSGHVATLTALMEAYGFAVPENTAAAQAPATAEEAYEAIVKLETQSADLYESFLTQENLPESLRTVFAALKDASQNHLNACLRVSQRSGFGRGPMMNRGMFNRGRRGGMQWNDSTCPFCGGSNAGQQSN